jgi:hypothetical protein
MPLSPVRAASAARCSLALATISIDALVAWPSRNNLLPPWRRPPLVLARIPVPVSAAMSLYTTPVHARAPDGLLDRHRLVGEQL